MLEVKLLNSLAKVWPDRPVGDENVVSGGNMLLNDRLSFQAAYRCVDRLQCGIGVKVDSDLGDALTLRFVDNVPCDLPVPDGFEDVCEHPAPGLMPDILRPLPPVVWAYRNIWRALWLDVDTTGHDVAPGAHIIKLTLSDGTDTVCEYRLEVLDCRLPEQVLPVTNWFHSDCLCNYYNVEFCSEQYWQIMRNFAACAVKNGINTLLTPIFTPPLDTAPGGERRTTQLVTVFTGAGGAYAFDFSRLGRYIDVCLSVGVRYLEISHLFTQWGCRHAPKIIGTLPDGSECRLFGWDTDGTGQDYLAFLRAFLPELRAFLKARGVFERCFFHVSDEPDWSMRDQYAKGAAAVREFIPEAQIIDAISEPAFYTEGLIRTPVACLTSIDRFIDAGIKDMWGYYCCGQLRSSNRFLATPAYRNRVLGVQLFANDVKGFLQWGYNFYNTHLSYASIDPFATSTAGGWVPGGDAYVVYPGPDGAPWESMRLLVFAEALNDYRALTALLERGTAGSREAIVREFGLGKYPFLNFETSAGELIALRTKVNYLLAGGNEDL